MDGLSGGRLPAVSTQGGAAPTERTAEEAWAARYAALRRRLHAGARWDDDAVAALRALWAAGLSTATIGRVLGVTKNVVAGRAFRLRLAGRPSPIVRPAEAEIAGGGSRPPREAPMAPRVTPVVSGPAPRVAPAVVAAAGIFPGGQVAAGAMPGGIADGAPQGAPSAAAPPPASLYRRCRFPLWGHKEAPDGRFCGATTVLGGSWCAACRRRVFTRKGKAA